MSNWSRRQNPRRHGHQAAAHHNTSQYPQAERLLQAIQLVKANDPNFEMYVMLDAWIDAKNAWTEAVWDADNNAWVEGTGPDHTQGDVVNNSQEIETAVRLANDYGIVKAIAVGNEAMVQWAVNYFVYPNTILKWVNFLQDAKAAGDLPGDVWITSSRQLRVLGWRQFHLSHAGSDSVDAGRGLHLGTYLPLP